MIEARQREVLIVQRSANLDGSAFSALLLANGFREAGWKALVAFGFEGPIIEHFREAGHEAMVIPHDNWLRRPGPVRFLKDYLTEWRSASGFRPYLEQRSFDLVYVNSIVSMAGAVAARQTKTPCIWHLRELFADTGGEMHCPTALRPLVRWTLLNLPTTLVANSKAVAENVLGKAAADECTIVPNAAQEKFFENNTDQAAARALFTLPAKGNLIGLPGTLRPMKGHSFFLKDIAPLLHLDKDLHVAITGDGEAAYREGLDMQISGLDIYDQVHFLGSIENMPAFYRACDIACIPSRAEPFGRTVIEAFASGVPVVATSVGGIVEIVEDGETGLLIPYGDTRAFQHAIQTLLDHPEKGEELATAARKAAVDKYREEAYQQTLVGIAEGLTTQKNR